MPNPVIPKTNLTTGSTTTPPAAALQAGEIASNKFLGTLHIKKEDGTVADVAPVKTVAGVAPVGGNVALSGASVGAIPSSSMGVANGVATLDAGGKVPASQLPASIVGALQYQGTWNASTNTPTLASGVGTKGFYYTVNVAGTTAIDGHSPWFVADKIVFNGTAWEKIQGVDLEILTVNGVLPGTNGNIQLTPANLGAIATAQLGALSGVATLDAAGKLSSAQLTVATATVLGAIKVGANLTVGADGTLNATAAALATASASVLGGVKVGTTLSVGADGTLDVGASVLTVNSTINGGTY